MIQNLIFGNFFSENIILGIQLFHIRQHVPLNIIRDFFKIQISWQKVSKPTITSDKKSLILQYSFTQKTSLILRNSTHWTLKIIFSRNTAKILSDFTNVLASMFLFGVRKNICTAPPLDAQELHS